MARLITLLLPSSIVIEVVYQLAISIAFYSIETVLVYSLMILKNLITRRKMFYMMLKGRKHTHIAIYAYEKTVSTPFYPTDNTLPWSCDPSNLEAVENIYYGNAEILSAITERDIFNVLKLDRLNGHVIDSFICSLISKQQYLKVDAISSILSQILANMSSRENRSIFMKYLERKMIHLKMIFCLFQ